MPGPMPHPSDGTVHLVWLNTGLRCDGDSGSLTTATLPGVEDFVMGPIPGLPKAVPHWPPLVHGLGFEPVPLDLKASCQVPAHVRRSATDRFLPGGAWVRLQTDTIERLQGFRAGYALETWDEVIDRRLEPATGGAI